MGNSHSNEKNEKRKSGKDTKKKESKISMANKNINPKNSAKKESLQKQEIKGKNVKDSQKKKENMINQQKDDYGYGINNINIINENLVNIKGTKLDKNAENVLKTLIRIFCFKEEVNQICLNNKSENNNIEGIIVPKNLIDNYKKKFFFEEIKQNLNQNILNDINNKIKDSNNLEEASILEIINNLDRKFINKIENKITENPLKEEIGDVIWNYKCCEYFVNSKKIKRKLLIDFEIIDYDIFLLLTEQNIEPTNFLFVDYFINNNKILVLIKDLGDCLNNVFCEMGEYNEDQNIKIQYILDTEYIDDSKEFKNKLKKNGILDLYQKISEDKQGKSNIKLKEYNFKIFKIDDNNIKPWVKKEKRENKSNDNNIKIDVNDKKDQSFKGINIYKYDKTENNNEILINQDKNFDTILNEKKENLLEFE
jgi:hypothetical protein